MDRIEANARRALAAVGVAFSDTPLPAMQWDELLQHRNALNVGLTRMIDQAEAHAEGLTGAAYDAYQYGNECLSAVQVEMDARDQLGNRSPRSSSGRLAAPNGIATPRPERESFTDSRRFDDLFPGVRNGAQRPAFNSLAEMVRVACNNPLDARLVRNASMSEGIGESGGFAVPVQWVGDLLDRALEAEVIRPRATVLPVMTSLAVLPQWDYSNQTNGARAGLTLAWMAEGAEGTPQVPKLIPATMKMHKGAIWINLSNELAEDAGPAAERRIGTAMRNAVSAGLDLAFVFGNGVGKPQGIMLSPALITVNKEGSQSAATIVEDNVVKMAARLHPACWGNSVWLVSPTCLAQLLKLTQASGPLGGGRTALLTERDGTLFLLTRPVLTTDACAPLGTTGDIILADLSKYLVALRSDARIETSIHSGWMTDERGVRLILRLNGQSDWHKPITLRDGTNTVSCFVALETRG